MPAGLPAQRPPAFLLACLPVCLAESASLPVVCVFACLHDYMPVGMSISLCVCLSACLFSCLCACLPVYLCVCLNACVSVCLSVCRLCLCIWQPSCLPVCLLACPSNCSYAYVSCLSTKFGWLPVCLEDPCITFCPSVCLSVSLPTYISACMTESDYLLVFQSACLFQTV